jgi:hypothetical protein
MNEPFLVSSPSTAPSARSEVAKDLFLCREGKSDVLEVAGVATVRVTTDAAESAFPEARYGAALLLESVSAPSKTDKQHLALALYGALRRARVQGKSSVLVASGVLSDEMLTLLGASKVAGSEHVAARLDIALHRLAALFEPLLEVRPEYYVQEIADSVRLHVERAFAQGFFPLVVAGRLSKEQYIYVMSQQHLYVRYTTRILGYCVAYSEDSALRRHFGKHLGEEINHEKIIEADLAYLGADVPYVMHDMEPSPATLQFVLGELALVSHYHDPILLTAAPLIAEGLSGHLDRRFVDRLNSIVASWGCTEPEKATRFFSSHIDFDGGEDGHFEGSMRLLAQHIDSERKLRRYLAAVHAQANSFLRIYDEAMVDAAVWG